MNKIGSVCVAFATALSGTMPAQAIEAIGGAKLIQNQVRGQLPGQGTRELETGDRVFENELVTTAPASLAQLQLVDLTNLSVGPSSSIKLDKFVFNGQKENIALNATKGAFRFISAAGDKRTYTVNTPTATIGVRGTEFDVRIFKGRTDVVLRKGLIDVCLRLTSNQRRKLEDCKTLRPGQAVSVTTAAVDLTAPDWSFDQIVADAGLIDPNVVGQVQPSSGASGGGSQSGVTIPSQGNVASGAISAPSLINGDFSLPGTVPDRKYALVTNLPGWTNLSGQPIELLGGSYGGNPFTSNSLDTMLTPNQLRIAQTAQNLIPNAAYTFSFELAVPQYYVGNISNLQQCQTCSVGVFFGGVQQTIYQNGVAIGTSIPGSSLQPGQVYRFSISVRANTTNNALEVRDLGPPQNFGLALDNVTVVAGGVAGASTPSGANLLRASSSSLGGGAGGNLGSGGGIGGGGGKTK